MTKEEKKEANRKYYLKNKDRIKEQASRYKEETGYNKKYYVQNSDKIKEQSGQYREDNKEYYKEYGKNYKKNRMKVDPIYKLNCGISRSIGGSLRHKGLSKKGRHWENLVGYTKKALKEYLEKLFEPGMTWDNHGEWHIDHIVPISFFEYDSTDDVEFKYCWSLHNLQPLWSGENLRKYNNLVTV